MNRILFVSGGIFNCIRKKIKLFRTCFWKMLEQNRKMKKSRFFFIQYTEINRDSIHILHMSQKKIVETQFDVILRSYLAHFMTLKILMSFMTVLFLLHFYRLPALKILHSHLASWLLYQVVSHLIVPNISYFLIQIKPTAFCSVHHRHGEN